MKNKNLVESFNRAIDGLVFCFRTQRNIRIHFLAALLVLGLSLGLHLSKTEFLFVLLAIVFVLVTEIINTAIEAAIDLFTDRYHALAAIAKDVAAGAVLVAAINALVTAYFVFFPKLNPVLPKVIESIINSPAHLTLIALGLVVFFVVLFKVSTGTGRPLSGGMPSGHAAVAFALSTAIIMISKDGLVASMALLLSLMVVQSRVEGGIHNVTEVIIGSFLGILVTFLIFQLYQNWG
ncbi:MAG TPA: phosphatase PAP2 family protein [Firmicutes bacterium]|jgi:diacylglycerol kinase (ATP)|nr:phosphatase PAP2 family protein [Bacillota bacterium]